MKEVKWEKLNYMLDMLDITEDFQEKREKYLNPRLKHFAQHQLLERWGSP